MLDFFVNIIYENLPPVCVGFGIIGHDVQDYKKNNGATEYRKARGDGLQRQEGRTASQKPA